MPYRRKKVGPQPWDTKVDLKAATTRELLSWLRGSYARGYYERDGVQYATTEELKEELKTREHIPNKKEAKELRRLSVKASEKQTRIPPKPKGARAGSGEVFSKGAWRCRHGTLLSQPCDEYTCYFENYKRKGKHPG